MDNEINKSTDFLNKCEDFIIEFFAYNLTTLEIVKKIYLKNIFNAQDYSNRKIVLDDEKLNLISHALNNKYLSSFCSERYSLFDISFREFESKSSIGFCFNDIKDSYYIEPNQIFKSFVDFGIDSIIVNIRRIQKSIFLHQPQYNPIFMIGLVFEGVNLSCIKAYIRFSLLEFSTSIEREYLVQRIVREINPKNSSVKYFSELTRKLEALGFTFSFVGIDSHANVVSRFKLYFRYYENNNFDVVAKEVVLILSQIGIYNNIQEVFNQHNNGLWGLAFSTDTFERVNGVQLYFYP